MMTSPIEKVHKLLTLAVGEATPEQEARTAALLAARMIMEHGLLSFAVPRDRRTLLDIAEELSQRLLDVAWGYRRKPEQFVQVGDVVGSAIKSGIITEVERKVVHEMLGNKVRYLRLKGVLVGQRGPYGGFRIAPGVRRQDV